MHADDQDGTWAAPAAAGPVRGRVRLPASKSITNRALVLAALSDRPASDREPAAGTGHPARGGRAAHDGQRGHRRRRRRRRWQRSQDRPRDGGSPPGSRPPVRESASTWATPAPSCGSCPRSPRLTSAQVDFDGDERIRERPDRPDPRGAAPARRQHRGRRPGRGPVHRARARPGPRRPGHPGRVRLLAADLGAAAGGAAVRRGHRDPARGPARPLGAAHRHDRPHAPGGRGRGHPDLVRAGGTA